MQVGTKIGPYEIIAKLGEGGMGEVYRARDTRLDRDGRDQGAARGARVRPAVARALRARSAKHLARSIIRTSAPSTTSADEGGTDFIVMELVEGETLAARLDARPVAARRGAARSRSRSRRRSTQAHRAGIVHRDLKPGNMMLTHGRVQRRTAAKLLDFGLAKRAGAGRRRRAARMPTTPAELTAAGAILGTFQYMAPEQLEGENADARTDIFAFGAVVYEMVTGRKAFDGEEQGESDLRDSARRAAPARIGSANTGLSA